MIGFAKSARVALTANGHDDVMAVANMAYLWRRLHDRFVFQTPHQRPARIIGSRTWCQIPRDTCAAEADLGT